MKSCGHDCSQNERDKCCSGGGRDFRAAKEILQKYGNDSSKLLPILQEIQRKFRYLPEDVMAYIATEMKVPPAQVFGVATFFAYFTLTPKGENIIKICDGTACHVKKSEEILKFVRDKFNLTQDKITSDDGFVTLETVACLGACSLAPVVVINDVLHGNMTVAQVEKLLAELMSEGK